MNFKLGLSFWILIVSLLAIIGCAVNNNNTATKKDLKPWPILKPNENTKVNNKSEYIIINNENKALTHADSFVIKKEYKIAILLPFKLDSMLGNNSLPSNHPSAKASAMALDFYEGAIIALDSLKKTNCSLFVNIIDFSNWGTNFKDLAASKHLDTYDLFIGTLNSTDAKVVAAYALEHKINFISPVANAFIPERNSFYCGLNPFLIYHQKCIMELFQKDFTIKNTLVIRGPNATDNTMANSYKTQIKTDYKEFIVSQKVTTDSLESNLSATKKNYIFLTSNDANYVVNIVKKLSQLSEKYAITVYGMQGWSGIDNLKNAVSKNMEVIYTSSFQTKKAAPDYQLFVKRFTEKFHEKPSEMAVRGYCNILLANNWLLNYGSRFNYFNNNVSFNTLYNTIVINPVYETKEFTDKRFIKYYYNQSINIVTISAHKFKIDNQIIDYND